MDLQVPGLNKYGEQHEDYGIIINTLDLYWTLSQCQETHTLDYI